MNQPPGTQHHGCTCPTTANNHGWVMPAEGWITHPDCPLHTDDQPPLDPHLHPDEPIFNELLITLIEQRST